MSRKATVFCRKQTVWVRVGLIHTERGFLRCTLVSANVLLASENILTALFVQGCNARRFQCEA